MRTGAALALCGAVGLASPGAAQGPAMQDTPAVPRRDATPTPDPACVAGSRPRPLTCRSGVAWLRPPEYGPAVPAMPTGAKARAPHAVLPPRAGDTADEGRNWAPLAAVGLGLLVAVPGVAIGHAIDRELIGDEASESPGLVGAFVGGSLGFGLGGVVGAHLASGRKGNIWIPLGVLGAAAPLMAVDLEVGFRVTLAAVAVAIAIES
ncbi:MAG TPA: hypothetical protein VML95_06330 [Longimicrobiales bacterium]|nr:hypothetical protein [Longimicrobiales bacterium]